MRLAIGDGFDDDAMLPPIPEVLVVPEFADPIAEERREALTSLGDNLEFWEILVRNPKLEVADVKGVQVRVRPSHDHLKYAMNAREPRVDLNLQPSPYERLDSLELDTQRVNRRLKRSMHGRGNGSRACP